MPLPFLLEKTGIGKKVVGGIKDGISDIGDGIGDLFKKGFETPDAKVQAVQTPYESLTHETSNRSGTDTTNRNTVGSTSLTGRTDQFGRTSGVSGLQDQSLLNLLTGQLRAAPQGSGAGVHNQIAQNRVDRSTPSGYAAASRAAREDFSNTLRNSRHLGAAAYRSGDYAGREFHRAADSLGRNLLSAHDQAQFRDESGALDAADRANAAEFVNARNLANILQTAPFTRTNAQDQTGGQTSSQNQATTQNEIATREFLEELAGMTDSSGFNTQTHFTPQTSPIGQIAGLIGAGVGAFTGGGG